MDSNGVRCPACESSEVSNISPIPDHEYGLATLASYAHCGVCQTAFQVPMPSEVELSAFYPANYHSMSGGGVLMRMRHELRMRRLKAVIPRGEGVVLDYGCGNGSFLCHASSQMPGTKFFGFEIAGRREVVTKANGAVTIVQGDSSHLLDLLPQCKVIMMNHVIEHLPDPFATLSELYARLVPGGVLDGQTPATDSLEHRIFGRLWSGYHAPRHTVIFSSAGLYRFLARVGFEEVRIKPAFNPAGVAVSLASLSHGPSASGVIPRHGLRWIVYLGLAVALLPADLLSGAPGIIDFVGRKEEA